MTVNPSNENRIRQLEAQVSRLAAVVEALRAQRTGGEVDQIIRPARTCDPSIGSYPTTGVTVPIQFLDVEHSGLPSSVTKGERATAQQAATAAITGGLVPNGSDGVAFRYGRQWFWVSGPNLKLIKAPSGGIPGRVGTLLGGVICDVWVESTTNSQLVDSGEDIKVENWTTSAACATGDRYGIAGWVNGSWYVLAEDCNDEGSTTQPGTGSGTGGRIGDAIDTSTVSPVVGIGVGGQVLYSGGAAPIP